MSGQASPTNTKALTAKQAQFVREYLIDLNATQAAIRAGYSEKTAAAIGDENLRKPEIAAAVQSAMDARSQVTEITAQSVLSRINSVIDRCMQTEAVRDREGTATGEYKFDSSGALKGLDLLGKHLKLFTDKVEVSVDGDLAAILAARRNQVASLNG